MARSTIFSQRWIGLLLVLIAGMVGAMNPGRTQTSTALVVQVQGAIGVATDRQIEQAIAAAQAKKASVLVMQLDTPGGLVSATRNMIQAMIAAPVPIIVYVSPSGARAAS